MAGRRKSHSDAGTTSQFLAPSSDAGRQNYVGNQTFDSKTNYGTDEKLLYFFPLKSVRQFPFHDKNIPVTRGN